MIDIRIGAEDGCSGHFFCAFFFGCHYCGLFFALWVCMYLSVAFLGLLRLPAALWLSCDYRYFVAQTGSAETSAVNIEDASNSFFRLDPCGTKPATTLAHNPQMAPALHPNPHR